MNGFPRHMNTKKDYENCHLMALAGEMDKVRMKAAWQRLIATAKIWAFKAVVDEAYIPLADEKVVTEKRDGVDVYTCFELIDDPNCEMAQLFYTVTTANQKIAELEVQ